MIVWLTRPTAGVVVLSSTQSSPGIFTRDIALQGASSSVWNAFGISTTNAQLQDFMKAIDPTNSLTVKINNATSPDPNPNALWCVTTPVAYQTTVKLDFVLDVLGNVENSPVGEAVLWINQNLSLTIDIEEVKKVLGNVPEILITASKTTLYDVQDLTATEHWTISFQFSIPDFNLAFQFSDTDTSFYLIPTVGTSDIVDSLLSAIGTPTGLDRSQM